MIVYGERLLAGPGGAQAARALLNVASRLGPLRARRRRPARGARPPPTRAACARPASRPATAPATRRSPSPARTRPGIAAALAGGELSTVWLHHADPLRSFPDRAAWEAALGAAQTVIAVDSVLTDTIREHADVVFPAEAYAEKEGTVTHPDGRVQRLRPAIGRPKGPDQQSGSGVRPLWQVIADVAERAGLELGVRTGPDGLQAAVRGRAVLRRADARRDRRPRRPLARLRGGRDVRGRRLGARQARGAGRRAGDGRGRAAPRHVPLAVELQGGRRLAVAALPAPAPGRRALARRRRAARHPRGRPGRGRLQRDARQGRRQAARRRARRLGVPRRGHARPARQRADRADGRGPAHRRPEPHEASAAAAICAPAAEGLAEMPSSAPLDIPEGQS